MEGILAGVKPTSRKRSTDETPFGYGWKNRFVITPTIPRLNNPAQYSPLMEQYGPLTYSGHFAQLYSCNSGYYLLKRLDARLKANGQRTLTSRGDFGNNFLQEEFSLTPPSLTVRESGRYIDPYGFQDHWSGPVYPDNATYTVAHKLGTQQADAFPSFPSNTGLSKAELAQYGASFISQTIPTIPEVSISTSVGELFAGLPKLPLTALYESRKIASLGNEYLNLQFGIEPTVRDTTSILMHTKVAEERLRQLRNMSGSDVRRRRTLPKVQTSSSTTTTGVFPTASNWSSRTVGQGALTITDTVNREIWFSGSFRYDLTERLDGWINELTDFNRKYGAFPNALTAWNLMPWSWLVDWFTNAGDIVTNISYLGRDGLWMRYGYVMCHSTLERTSSWTGPIMFGVNKPTTVATTHVVYRGVTKQRLRASRLGFGVSEKSLSGDQKAILSALGLSRLRSR